MAKLTKAQRAAIERALYDAKRAFRYVMADGIAVARKDTKATTTLHYSRSDGASLYEVEKHYGSDLCGLADAIRRLEQVLNIGESS